MSELKEVSTLTTTAHDDLSPSGLPSTIDVGNKTLPEWFLSLPVGTQQVLALMSLGFTDIQIARRCNVEVLSIQNCRYNHLTRHKRVLMLSPADRAVLQVAIVEAKAMDAVESIDSTALDASSAVDRSRVAKNLAETAKLIASRNAPASVEFTDLEARMRVRISK